MPSQSEDGIASYFTAHAPSTAFRVMANGPWASPASASTSSSMVLLATALSCEYQHDYVKAQLWDTSERVYILCAFGGQGYMDGSVGRGVSQVVTSRHTPGPGSRWLQAGGCAGCGDPHRTPHTRRGRVPFGLSSAGRLTSALAPFQGTHGPLQSNFTIQYTACTLTVLYCPCLHQT